MAFSSSYSSATFASAYTYLSFVACYVLFVIWLGSIIMDIAFNARASRSAFHQPNVLPVQGESSNPISQSDNRTPALSVKGTIQDWKDHAEDFAHSARDGFLLLFASNVFNIIGHGITYVTMVLTWTSFALIILGMFVLKRAGGKEVVGASAVTTGVLALIQIVVVGLAFRTTTGIADYD